MTTLLRKDLVPFLRAFLANPRAVGAVAPSGSYLARAVAAQIDLAKPGPILELGPGTGGLTRGVLERGIPAERLTAVEYDPDLARSFADRFAGVHVVNGDAFDVDGVLGTRHPQPFAAIVSGIPLLNYPLAARRALVAAWLKRTIPGGPYIQFSYGWHSPLPPSAEISATRAAFVPLNIPPAFVWVYRAR